jgi:hypothetical protein
MKTTLVIVAVCALVLLTSLVVGQDQPPLPPGVAASEWIPIGENAGFVVLASSAKSSERLSGYFLAKHGNTWKRLDSQGAFEFQPLKK